MKNTIKKTLKPLASLRLTVTLLAMAMFLIFAGTLAQVDRGIMEVTNDYFRGFIVFIDLAIFIPESYRESFSLLTYITEFAPIPFPGAFAISAALMVNLLAAHILRFKMAIKRVGIIALHLGLIILLCGEIITGLYQEEGFVSLFEGETTNFVESYHDFEMVLIDPSDAENDQVIAIKDDLLKSHVGKTIVDAQLPAKIFVHQYMPNSGFRQVPPMMEAAVPESTPLVEIDKYKLHFGAMPKVAGTNNTNQTNVPTAIVTLVDPQSDATIGRYTLNGHFAVDQRVTIGEKEWIIDLRREREYRNYSMTLQDLSFEHFVGTNTPKNYESTIKLTDPEKNINRENIRIFMNNPLRYRGQTYYQSQMDTRENPAKRGTTLMVVRNPGWLLPYISCTIITLGMLVHFIMRLLEYLRRDAKRNAKEKNKADLDQKSDQADQPDKPRDQSKAQTPANAMLPDMIKPDKGRLLMWTLIFFAVGAFLFAGMTWRNLKPIETETNNPHQEFNLESYSLLPASSGGRVKPLDTVARTKLLFISTKTEVKTIEGEKISAIQWLMEVMAGDQRAFSRRVFRIDEKMLLQELEIADGERKLFSYMELLPHRHRIRNDASEALRLDSSERNIYQREIIELNNRIVTFDNIRYLKDPYLLAPIEHDQWRNFDDYTQAMDDYPGVIISDPNTLKVLGIQADGPYRATPRELADRYPQMRERLNLVVRIPEQRRSEDDRNFMRAFTDINTQMQLFQLQPVHMVVLNAHMNDNKNMEPQARRLLTLLFAWQLHDPDEASPADWTPTHELFNNTLAEHHQKLEEQTDIKMGKKTFEVFYNRFSPFMQGMALYVLIFIASLFSFMLREYATTIATALRRASFWLLILTFVIHSFGVIARIYLQERPPVTNLYSSAIFVGWGVVFMGIFFEWYHKLGFATAASALVGFCTLVVAYNLSFSGDTMEMMQAVLDSNFWLATHVIIVTLGYVATFLAGALAILYIFAGFFTPWQSKSQEQKLTRMVYGVTCFALLFSFVGTILGGIWADQSWGRFWGWDPKENGAAMVVLNAAIILHARWGGLIRERGIMVLAVFGNIITAWAWFGVNLLSIGLHSYGFMDGGPFWMAIFIATMLLIMGIGLMPYSLWYSHTVRKIQQDAKATTA